MEHVVFYPGPDATPGYRRFASLDEAVRFVEHVRNVEGVSDVSVHALTAVPLAFRAYYKVEVPVDVPPPAAPVDAEPLAALVGAADDADASPNGKRSLGFFAH
jgi:hypothetical protein